MNIENIVITDELINHYAEEFLKIREDYFQEYGENLEMEFDLFFKNSIKLQFLEGSTANEKKEKEA